MVRPALSAFKFIRQPLQLIRDLAHTPQRSTQRSVVNTRAAVRW